MLFPGGYATINGTAVTFHYYTQDYLGNNRAVINGSTGAIEQTVAYYPYGGIIPDLGNPRGGQPYRFGGKELITANGLNEYDFGARWYYQAVPHFTKPDPMCEKYYWLSPYLYCANNPVNLTDPTGMYIVKESQEEWNGNRKDIEKRRDGLQKSIDNITAKGATKGWSQDRIDRKIGDRQERVASLDNTLSTMTTLENSEQGYSLSSSLSNSGETYLKDNGIIGLRYHKGSVALFCHEVTHAGQFETGDIAFNLRSGYSYLNDVYDEAAAFQAQYAYDPNTVNGLNPNMIVSSIADISPEYVMGIRDSNGMSYAPGGANNVGSVMVRIDSPVEQLLIAFPNHTGYIDFVNSHRYIRHLPNIHYKR